MATLNRNKRLGKTTKIFFAISSVILLVFILGFLYLNHGTTASPSIIWLKDIKVENKTLLIQGDTTSSAMGFSGYSYIIEDETLYLEVRYSLVTRLNPSGSFSIQMNGNFEEIKKIFLRGNANDQKLIWNR